jgi:hypothetical protein
LGQNAIVLRRTLLVLALSTAAVACARQPLVWRTLDPGLELAGLSTRAGQTIHALRVDPGRFEFRLLMASEKPPARSVRAWCESHGLLAGINAGLFQEDLLTATALLKSRTHKNNRQLARHRAVLAFDPLDGAMPPVQIIDRDHQPYEEIAPRYGSLLQGIRMIALDGRNVWAPQDQRYAIAAVALDRSGRVLLLHTGGPARVHEFIDELKALPLGIRNAMYLEGGATAQFYVNAGGARVDITGGLEGLFAESNPPATPVPNVLGVVRRGK